MKSSLRMYYECVNKHIHYLEFDYKNCGDKFTFILKSTVYN
jgi:hypothetical protein